MTDLATIPGSVAAFFKEGSVRKVCQIHSQISGEYLYVQWLPAPTDLPPTYHVTHVSMFVEKPDEQIEIKFFKDIWGLRVWLHNLGH